MEFFTIKETAAKMKVSTYTVRRLIKSAELNYCRVGRQIRITGKNIYDYAHRRDSDTSSGEAAKC